MLRFASSPTSDMNINELRSALFTHLTAQQKKEDLIIRIEDMDKEKNIDGMDQEILDILGLFGINHAQVIYQSESIRFHSAMALQLVHEKQAFSCFCSPQWIERKREEAKLANKEYFYDNACRNLPAELVIDNTSPFTIRIVKPDNSVVDSFIILNQDKFPTYDFSTSVDDMLNNISVVICNADNKNNILKQEHIRDSLKYDKKIQYIYLDIIDDAPSVKHLLAEGFLPEAISNYLISIQNTTPKEIFTLVEAREWFTFNTASNSPILFDIDKLRQINQEHLKALDVKELSRYVGFADIEIGELARVYLDEAATTKELKEKIALIFNKHTVPDSLLEETFKMKITIKDAPYFEDYTDFKNYIIKKSALEEEKFSQVFRILLTGTQDGPDLAIIYKYLKNYIGEIIK